MSDFTRHDRARAADRRREAAEEATRARRHNAEQEALAAFEDRAIPAEVLVDHQPLDPYDMRKEYLESLPREYDRLEIPWWEGQR